MKKILLALAILATDSKAQAQQTEEDKARIANEQRVAREAYGKASGHKSKKKKGGGSHKREALNEAYVGYGAALVKSFSSDAPYQTGFNLHWLAGFPLADNKLVLEPMINTDVMFGTNKTWYARAYNMSLADVDPIGFSSYSDFSMGVYYTALNTKTVALTVGPTIGAAYYLAMSPISYSSYNSYTGSYGLSSDDPSGFTYCYGIKAALHLGDHVMFSAQYQFAGITSGPTAYASYPVSFNTFRLGVTVKRESYWW